MSGCRWIAEFSTPSEHWVAEGHTQREAGTALHRKWDEHQVELERTDGHVPFVVRQYHALLGRTFDEYWHVTYHKVAETISNSANHNRWVIKVHSVTLHRSKVSRS